MTRTAWIGPLCPQDPSHGVMLGWPGSTTAWMCPHRRHDGRQFYDSDLNVAARPNQPISPLRSSGQPASAAGSSPSIRGSRRADPTNREGVDRGEQPR